MTISTEKLLLWGDPPSSRSFILAMRTRDTFNIPQLYITHITVKETHFSALHPATVQNGSTRLRNLTIFHWLWGDCDIEVDSCWIVKRVTALLASVDWKAGWWPVNAYFDLIFSQKPFLIDSSASSATFSACMTSQSSPGWLSTLENFYNSLMSTISLDPRSTKANRWKIASQFSCRGIAAT